MKSRKFQNKYRIPSARAVWHDYNGGEYFITICTAHREHYFGKIQNDEMILNGLGQKLDDLIGEIKTHNSYAVITVHQIMPNHVHLIVCIDGAGGRDAEGRDAAFRDAACHVSTGERDDNDNRDAMYGDVTYGDAACHVSTGINEKMREIADKCGMLSTTMGCLKSALTKYANDNKINFGWQTRFHDHIIRDQDEMNLIANYIVNNPAKWKEDKFFSE